VADVGDIVCQALPEGNAGPANVEGAPAPAPAPAAAPTPAAVPAPAPAVAGMSVHREAGAYTRSR